MIDLKVEEKLREAMAWVTELGTEMLQRLEHVTPMVFVFKGTHCGVHTLDFGNIERKHMSVVAIREKMKSEDPDMAVFISEAWMVKVPIEQERSLMGASLAEHPNRIEVVTVIGAADECSIATSWEIARDEAGKPKIVGDVDTGMTGDIKSAVFTGIFKPGVAPGHC